MDLLQVKNLSKYFGGLAAVSDLSFTLDKGEILGLIGPNGAGKTTIFNVVSGIYSPTQGEITFAGKPIAGLKPYQVARRGIVRTFQATVIYHSVPVIENVIRGCYMKTRVGYWGVLCDTKYTQREMRRIETKAMDLVEFMGLSSWVKELAMNLPYGLQRTLGVTVALASEPQLLMLDEPVTGMNPEEIQHMMGLIRKIRDHGVTILLVEHDMKMVMGVCNRIVVINYGRKIAEGTPKDIRENNEVIEAYLGTEDDITA